MKNENGLGALPKNIQMALVVMSLLVIAATVSGAIFSMADSQKNAGDYGDGIDDDIPIPMVSNYTLHVPKGADVYIDGAKLAQKPGGGQNAYHDVYAIPEISPGVHALRIEHPEYNIYTEQIDISQNGRNEYYFYNLMEKRNGGIELAYIELVPFVYDKIGYRFEDGLLEVGIDDREAGYDYKWGFIDKTGNEVVPPIYDEVGKFEDGLAKVRIGNRKTGSKYGYIDKTGNEVVAVVYDELGLFSDGLAIANLDGKWGCIDKTGKEVVPFVYNVLRGFSDDLAAANLNGKWGFIDKTGKEVVPFIYDYTKWFSDGLAQVGIGDWETGFKYGYTDKSGNEVVPIIYDSTGSWVSGGLTAVSLNGKWGFVDNAGREVVPPIYDNVGLRYSNGFIEVVLNGKYGYIDRFGNEIVPPVYDEVDWYHGVLRAGIGDQTTGFQYIYVNNAGREVDPPVVDRKPRKPDFYPDLVISDRHYKHGVMDKAGYEILPPVYDSIERFSRELIWVRFFKMKGNCFKNGLVDKAGNEVVPPIYDNIRDLSGELTAVSFNGKWGFISIVEKSGVAQPVELSENSHMETIQSYEDSIDSSGELSFVPHIVEKTFFENEILKFVTNKRDLDKLNAYYTLIDASDPDLTEVQKKGLLEIYPYCGEVPVYMFDFNASQREIDQILGFIKLYTNLTNDDILKMYDKYGIPYIF